MGSLGPLEIGLIILAILLLFGYKKLPDASRSLGRSLRIFKGEMKGMKDDDSAGGGLRSKDAAQTTPVRGEIVTPTATPAAGDLSAQLAEEARVAELRAAELRAADLRARADQARAADGSR
jgi:sec-independent protein translocase protein TatA